MTNDKPSKTEALRALLSETPDAHVTAAMLGFVAGRMMALDVNRLFGAAALDRSADRMSHRKRIPFRVWEARAATVDVKIPKLLQGAYFPEFFEPRWAAEKAMTTVREEAHVPGVSTRFADDLVKAMGSEADQEMIR